MAIESKECFAALTEDGQLWEIYQAAQSGGGGGGSPTGPAGGDLSGTYPNPTVDGLQGNPVSNAMPSNGQVLQFDGTSWVPGSIPSGGSGGGGVVYFLNFNTAADAPVTNIPQTPNASKELGITAETTATSFTSANLSTAGYDLLASFVTDLNVPSATAIPAGVWDFNIWAESTTANAANHVLYKIEVLKYDGVNAPVLLATSVDSYIYDPQDITQYVTSVVLPQTTILATDRIVVYLYGRATQNNKNITFHFGSGYPTHVHSTMPSVTGTGVVKVVNGVFQSPASTIVDSDVSATANIAQSKIANLTTDLAAKVSKSGDTMNGKLTAPANAALAGLNIGPSLASPAPATTVDGDIWITNQNKLAFRASSNVINVAGLNQTNTFSQPQTIGSTSNATPVFTASNTGTREAAVFNAQGTSPAVRITQTGTGEALRVEDDTTPDATAFVVSNSGKVGVGVTPDATVSLSVDTTGIKFGDGSIQTTAATSITADVQVFTSTGTWTKPVGAKTVNIQLFGAGGGGGGGRKESTASVSRGGGAGGGGGSALMTTINASALSATETVTIGLGGIAGLGRTGSPAAQDGGAGGAGGDTTFNSFICPGGRGGAGGTSGAAAAGIGLLNANSGAQGNTGGNPGSNGIPASNTAAFAQGGVGGGSGGGITNANAINAGGSGGRSNILNLSGGIFGASGGGNGGNGLSNTNAINGVFAVGSGGGGGGAANLGGIAGNGGNGGFPAGGGGGGGASDTTSGAGGAGGDGLAIITTYF